jgi:hypothetical protein
MLVFNHWGHESIKQRQNDKENISQCMQDCSRLGKEILAIIRPLRPPTEGCTVTVALSASMRVCVCVCVYKLQGVGEDRRTLRR